MTQAGYLVTGFGTPEYVSGSSPTPFKYGGANGCQTDNDTGLVLMGYRYYDTRIGRFISQDPAGDGDNWYAYCDNSPVNGVDPTGLSLDPNTPGAVQYPDGQWHYPPGVPEPQAGGATFSPDGVAHSSSTVHIPSSSGGDVTGPSLISVAGTVDLGRLPTLLTGPYADRSIPARSTARDWTAEEINQINEIGNESGCHTCGTRISGNRLGTWVKDHQPPSKINPPGNSQRLYPQCKKCSASQGGTLSRIKEEVDEFIQAVRNMGCSSSSASSATEEGESYENSLEMGDDPFEVPIFEIP